MDMKNHFVIHKVFGEGKVLDHAGVYLIISFEQGEKKFIYPDSFKDFLKAKDDAVRAEIQNEVAEIEQQKTQAQQEKERAARLEKERLAERSLSQSKPRAKNYPRANIAFKCNYCDGGKSLETIGFNGLCSEEMIRYNIKTAKHIWCSSESPCRQYYDGSIVSYANLVDKVNKDENGVACYESVMLRDWRASAGITQTGENKGRPMRLMRVQLNSLAVLTTRLPYDSDEDRFIFAVFLVDETHEGNARDEGYVSTDSKYKIQMTPAEAQKLKFWNYYFCENAPEVIKFGSGLHRYLSDEQAAQILRDIADVKKGTAQEELAQEFYKYFCRINGIDITSIPPNNGALARGQY